MDRGFAYVCKMYFLLGLLLSIAGCLHQSGLDPKPLLNSERIEHKFGSYGIEILQADEHLRISNLYSVHENVKVTRTLAVVAFPDTIDAAFTSEHQQIVSGGSIGAVFKSGGWGIRKQHSYFGEIECNNKFVSLFKHYQIDSVDFLAIHIYDLFVSSEGTEFRYATIAEIHSPEYLKNSDLQDIYGDKFNQFSTETDALSSTIDLVIDVIENL